MSDETIPDLPDVPDPPGLRQASAGLSALTLYVYDLAWLLDTTSFAVNDNVALAWTLTQLIPAGNVPDPKSGSVIITRPDGKIDSPGTLYSSSTAAAAAINLFQIYQFTQSGVYMAELQIVIDQGDGTPPQTRSSIVRLAVT